MAWFRSLSHKLIFTCLNGGYINRCGSSSKVPRMCPAEKLIGSGFTTLRGRRRKNPVRKKETGKIECSVSIKYICFPIQTVQMISKLLTHIERFRLQFNAILRVYMSSSVYRMSYSHILFPRRYTAKLMEYVSNHSLTSAHIHQPLSPRIGSFIRAVTQNSIRT